MNIGHADRPARLCGGKGGRRPRAFTLVELLVVMGIFTLLMSIALPVFLRPDSTAAAHGALLRIKSTFNFARQWAVTRGTTTFVVFPHDDSAIFTGAPHLAVTAMRGFNVMTREDGWLGEWQFLPVGFVFSKTHGSVTNLFSATTNDRVFQIPFPLTNSTTRPMRCISFHPNGRLNQNGATTLEVVFTQGTIYADPNGGTVANYTPAPNAPAFGLRVRPLTGRSHVVEYPP